MNLVLSERGSRERKDSSNWCKTWTAATWRMKSGSLPGIHCLLILSLVSSS